MATKKSPSETTSKAVASKASKILSDPKGVESRKVGRRERADAAREEEVSRTIDSTQDDGITIAPDSCTLLASSMSAMFGASTFTSSSSAMRKPTEEHLHADHA